MQAWPAHPSIYEINTWVWLAELGPGVTLADVPANAWDDIAALGFDAVWLMGVWQRSPAGIAVANRNAGLLQDFRRALPDFRPEDNVGSPYCVRDYSVDPRLGGRAGLAEARAALARRGLRLVLDFVPNHVAPDHWWASSHPDYFVRGTPQDAERDPASFLAVGANVYANGRDPYFPAWPDVLQLNAFSAGLRAAAIDTVRDIASQCDGVRCDMAMLMLNQVFERTWAGRAGVAPETDYWRELIPAVRAEHPDFRFIAEAYWDLEWELQQQGFDFCYDKRLYDRLEHGDPEALREHLCADLAYQRKLLRFIENHDEPRAAATFAPDQARAAAVLAFTQCGARLVHEGQMEGRKVRLPVFLGRRPAEAPDEALRAFYRHLLQASAANLFHAGEWQLCERIGWPDNASYERIVAWCWRLGEERALLAVNLADTPSQGQVKLPWDELAGATWGLDDELAGTTFEREGNTMRNPGLYIALQAWGCHFLRLRRAGS
ncbi:alpha-amylase [Ramlibacter sp. G-1-2-2]|uniref:Alpha-amylase n=1 Tax=Ramlibacter agri TaxID=2728837 RepID=A0A848GX64_9BURK|nr:alpha-amylase family glycosyl hydrolase [Ramlibacter agri]NML43185.1 alpha-amylase [Ramlibacter agri]